MAAMHSWRAKVGMMIKSTGNYGRSNVALGDDLVCFGPMPCNSPAQCPSVVAGIASVYI